jgi:predicted ester cyclase
VTGFDESNALDDALRGLDRAIEELELRVGRRQALSTFTSGDALSRQVIEVFELAFFSGCDGYLDELCDSGLRHHNPPGGLQPTLQGVRSAIREYAQAFPDLRTEDLQVMVDADGRAGASHWTVSGTHDGELFGIRPTGKRVTVEGMNSYRLSDGRISEMWTRFDRHALFRQLGE